MHSSILFNGYKSLVVTILRFLWLTQSRRVSSFFCIKTTEEAYSVCVGSIAFITRRFSISDRSKSPAFCAAQYGTKCIGPIVGDLR